MSKHREIRLKTIDNFKLYLRNRGICIPKQIWKNQDKFNKLFDEGTIRIEKMLDLKRLIRDNRNFKILLNNSLMSKDIRDKIRHVEKNLIDLDSELSESEDYNNE